MTKKIWVLFLLVLLTGCRVAEEEMPEEVLDQVAPNFYGAEDVEIDYFEIFNPLEGVTAYDVQDGFLTGSITFEGQVDASEYGTYLLKYRVTDSDNNQKIHIRYVTVVVPPSELINIFPYGDFFNELEGFDIYQEEDKGHATFNVVGGVLEVELLSVETGVWYRPRLNTTGVTFRNDTVYRIQFEAKADDSRVIQLQVGELLSHDPWFDKFDQTVHIFTITDEWVTYSYEFVMHKDTNDNGSILFEFGDVSGDKSLTTIYLDKIRIYKVG